MYAMLCAWSTPRLTKRNLTFWEKKGEYKGGGIITVSGHVGFTLDVYPGTILHTSLSSSFPLSLPPQLYCFFLIFLFLHQQNELLHCALVNLQRRIHVKYMITSCILVYMRAKMNHVLGLRQKGLLDEFLLKFCILWKFEKFISPSEPNF